MYIVHFRRKEQQQQQKEKKRKTTTATLPVPTKGSKTKLPEETFKIKIVKHDGHLSQWLTSG